MDERRLEQLPTAALADALVRLEHPLRIAPPELHPLLAGSVVVGRALPVRHSGSVDVFLEAFESATPGAFLVIDNGGRNDEGCIGDLTRRGPVPHTKQRSGPGWKRLRATT